MNAQRPAMACLLCLVLSASLQGFPVDTSEQPAGHPPLTPADGEAVTTNPPAMIWRLDERARSYVLELCQNPDFARQVIRVADLDMPFYNHSATLAEGKWHWRYFVMAKDGQQSEPSPVRSFVVSRHAVPLPVPSTKDILAAMPRHPRVFVTPDTLDAFRQRRLGPAKEAWDDLKWQADRHLASAPPQLKLQAFPEKPSDRRGLVFRLKDGQPFVPSGYVVGSLNADAAKANALSLAYVISGDPRYAEAARLWALFLADFRVDYHLKDRAQHDTVVYCYEYGLKYVALTFDRIHDVLSDAERRRILDHVDYHGEAAYQWCRDRLKLHLNYQNSHGQQCMHALLSTALAVAADSPKAAEWTDYLVRQYVNRIAWGGDDGGYSEGQKYGHKVQYILEALAALKTATGIDLFQKPRWRNTGDFWLYCMSLNYWWNHWGDCYSLVDPSFGSDADTYLTGFLATLTGNRCVKWYSDTRVTNPAHVPFWYLSASGLKPKPPVDIPQARLFPEAGQLAAYDRFYDHGGNRIFFRSSPWGGHSHAHADQNGFVLHVGGEIMACDAGYYTYAGDTYHKQWSVTTQAHNSILVNGQGQPKSIESKGRVSAFLNAPGGCFFLGDAARAYGSSLTRFDRAVLFIRPDVFIVYDELNAKEPADFTWVLNTFEAADIAPASRLMVVKQRRKRLAIRHLSPEALEYSQTNQRPFPIKDPKRAWSRFTEAFPQPWNIRVKTAAKREAERILAFMEAYDESAGPRTRNVERIVAPGALGVRFTTDAGVHTTIFRMAEEKGAVKADGLVCDARVVSVRRDGQGRVLGWLVHDGASLLVGGQPVFQSDRPCDLAADFSPPRRVFGAAFDLVSCAAQVCVQRAQPTDLRL
ncbi:MAG: DUF4962 domain-containing protein, partial [Planctomycetes bacterium]|nr:DUF4962 domain-containing protein [Planctomycetota bacterium]